MSWVCIGSYSLPIEAQIAKARLRSVNIPVRIDDEYMINMNWLYSNLLGGIRLWVPEQYESDARYLIDHNFSCDVDEELNLNAETCPECGNSDFESFTKGKRLAYFVFVVVGFPLAPFCHGKRCQHCGYFADS